MSGAVAIDIAAERKAVVAEAESWLRTPFQHRQRMKGVAVDCAQLLIAIYGELGFVDEVVVPDYSRGWFLHQPDDHLLNVIRSHCVPTEDPLGGDIATFRFGRHVSHAGIITDFPKMIHADIQIGCVTEDACGPYDAFGKRFAGAWTLKRWAL